MSAEDFDLDSFQNKVLTEVAFLEAEAVAHSRISAAGVAAAWGSGGGGDGGGGASGAASGGGGDVPWVHYHILKGSMDI